MNSPMGDFLRPEGYLGPQGLRALSRESSAAVELARYLRRARADRKSRKSGAYADAGRRHAHEPVMLIPGFMAGDPTLRAMSSMLRGAGYRTYRAQIQVNAGCTREAADRLERRLEAIAIRRGRKVSIVGHSLGGMLARGLAARRPDLVAGIVSMGSPIMAPGAVHGVLAWDAEMLTRLARAGFGGLMSDDCVGGECARTSFEEMQAPLDPDVAFTAIYSRRDGIVDWRACIDPAAEAVEVPTSHVGMAFDPVVFDVVRDALDRHQVMRASRAAAPDASAPLRPAVNR
ncbi:alpha/beta fold hydrolase [Nocardioides pocheonensis]|uniref:Alpha/beta fold hydrolase n=1 Tax=Nocardioides pocheonensis TaxID=661485 RepID=A0A3N0GKN5_9ACTN|nr:alpha/beta fold hydrolase [Nocardioides pocheonensis]RNM13047.1 alpha/beta fold hydrolase [Nocardioides pocheonensis]